MHYLHNTFTAIAAFLLSLLSHSTVFAQAAATAKPSELTEVKEKHLKNRKQLTFGGDNAEAYFNPSGTRVTCQITNPKWNVPCDQIYMIDLAQAEKQPPKTH
jgi:hypothetical protein